jgi:hypothetical protein
VPNAWLARELSLGHASSLSRYSRPAGDGQTAVTRLIEGLEEATTR